MKQVSIKLYQFSELEDDAKENALDEMRDANVNHTWWEFIYDDFKTIAAYVGITVDLKKTYFSGFYHQGQGSGFAASINVKELLHALQKQAWKEYAPKLELDFPKQKINRRVFDLIERGIIDTWAKTEPSNRGTSINVLVDLNFSSNRCINYNNIDEELYPLEENVKEVCEEMNHFLFTSLLKEYEYLTGDEAVRETIEANEYSFTVTGKPAFCIERLAE